MRNWIRQNWPIMPIIVALILLAVALFLNPSNFLNMAWFALVALTAVYAYATVMVVRGNKRTIEEMKQSRLDAVKPALSLQPGSFYIGGGFGALYLFNSGGVAKDVKVDIEVTNPDSKKFIFISAINREHKVYLQIGGKVYDTGGFVKVQVNFKDGYNQSLSESLSIDFSELKKEGREIRGQYSELNAELHEVKRVLESIERKIK